LGYISPQQFDDSLEMNAFSAIVEPNRRLVLKQANLVVVRPDGQKRWYELNAQPLMEVDEFLEPYRQYLSSKLDTLEQHLNEMDQ